jgi:predicted metal-dependent phosphoesterase TrpH
VTFGRVRVDCHLHTVASGDSVLTVEELANRARQEGLDVVCVTDHNVTHAAVEALAAERDLGVRVIVGEEIRTPDGDVIGLFLTERIPYVLPLPEVIRRIKAQHALVYVPHPFDGTRSSIGHVLPELCAAGDVDIIEVFNAKIANQALNDTAAALANSFALPGGAGSDAHDAPGVGAAYLEMPDFDGPASFLAGLADARITGEFRPHAPRYPRRPQSARLPVTNTPPPGGEGSGLPATRPPGHPATPPPRHPATPAPGGEGFGLPLPIGCLGPCSMARTFASPGDNSRCQPFGLS